MTDLQVLEGLAFIFGLVVVSCFGLYLAIGIIDRTEGRHQMDKNTRDTLYSATEEEEQNV